MWVSLRVKTMNMNHHVEVVENQVLQLTAYDMPEISADEVLVEVYYSGLCGSDVPRVFDKGAHFYPITLGHEFSGKVVAVGQDVEKYTQGTVFVVHHSYLAKNAMSASKGCTLFANTTLSSAHAAKVVTHITSQFHKNAVLSCRTQYLWLKGHFLNRSR